MKEKLRIIGLGRCVIGHLRKSLTDNYRNNSHDKIIFDHHYILNLATCLNPPYSTDESAYFFNIKCMPLLSDQLQCLENILRYDVCAIELFPPSPLYKHLPTNISVCFESFNNELAALGFKKNLPEDIENVRNVELHYRNIVKLINTIKTLNKRIKVILINGELIKHDGDYKVGSKYLSKLINKIKQSHFLHNANIKLLDINNLICTSNNTGRAFFETAFPYIYIQHTPNLRPIGLARDCKHAVPAVRKHFERYFCVKLRDWGFSLPEIQIKTLKKDIRNSPFTERANLFLNRKSKDTKIIATFENAERLSLFASYSIAAKSMSSYRILQNFINNFSRIYPSCGSDLKTFFYHLRTITAFIYETKINFNDHLGKIGIRILELPQNEIEPYSNFMLLWIKNIFLAGFDSLIRSKQKSQDCFIFFMIKLSENNYLKDHDVIQTMLSKQILKRTAMRY